MVVEHEKEILETPEAIKSSSALPEAGIEK